MVEDKWQLAQMLPEEIINMCSNRETAVLNQSVTASLNMLVNGSDIEVVEGRIQAAVEIAEGLGIDLQVPASRRLILQSFGRKVREKLEPFL